MDARLSPNVISPQTCTGCKQVFQTGPTLFWVHTDGAHTAQRLRVRSHTCLVFTHVNGIMLRHLERVRSAGWPELCCMPWYVGTKCSDDLGVLLRFPNIKISIRVFILTCWRASSAHRRGINVINRTQLWPLKEGRPHLNQKQFLIFSFCYISHLDSPAKHHRIIFLTLLQYI